MYKKMRFVTVVLLTVVCLIAAVTFSGCSADGGKRETDGKAYALSALKKTISVDEEYQLEVIGADGAEVIWSADDKTVVSVSENGLVKGLKEGTTKVYAKIGERTLSCEITVRIKLTEYAEIVLTNETDDEIKLTVGDEYVFAPILTGERTDAVVVLTSASDSVRVDGYTVTAVSAVFRAELTFSCDLAGVMPLTVYVTVI
ncbi:MAG: Ig-like domain-containing protein [Clostridia bacterium]|nr:Ig-like domain-containing protein [Clostridia bacterium]